MVLETSASMRGHKLFEAKHAILTVMDTLSIKDRVCIFFNGFINIILMYVTSARFVETARDKKDKSKEI